MDFLPGSVSRLGGEANSPVPAGETDLRDTDGGRGTRRDLR